MKKNFRIIGLIATVGLIVCLSSCDKRECKCTYTDDGRTRIFNEYPINHDAKNCKKLGDVLTAADAKDRDDPITFKCK
jgi:hypothetical protein